MRIERIARRWNLKSRAKAGRFLLNQQRRLTESMRMIYQSGYADRALEEEASVSTTHSHVQSTGNAEGGRAADVEDDGRGQLHAAVSQPGGVLGPEAA